jgi:hypothetical protein
MERNAELREQIEAGLIAIKANRFVQQSVAANGHPVGEPRRTDAA